MTTLPPPLPYTLDLACPIPLPPRRAQRTWAFDVAGPSTAEQPAAFLRRRYLETLYLGETLFPISGFLADLARADTPTAVAPLLLPLSGIEERRRALPPVLAAAIGAVESARDIAPDAAAAGLQPDEGAALAFAVDVRVRCRAVAEGKGVSVQSIGEELVRREVVVQLVMLLFYRSRKSDEQPDKKGKRKRPHPLGDTAAALEQLADRIGIWLAVGELGAAPDPFAAAVHHLLSVLVPAFPHETAFLASLRAKIVGEAIPLPDLRPAKKARKPAVTHKLDDSHPASVRAASIRRTSSRTAEILAPPRQVVRAPSGKDLFKGREVLLRRSSSLLRRPQTDSTSAGWLGAKAAGESLRRAESQSRLESASAALAETLVASTPARPRFRPATSMRAAPTPIREDAEPPSSGRTAHSHSRFVAETPVRREKRAFVAETPHALFERPAVSASALAAETPPRRERRRSSSYATYESEDDLSHLADLMVPTDDEDSEDDRDPECDRDARPSLAARLGYVPETPRRP